MNSFKPIDARKFELIKRSGWRHKDGTFAKGFHHTKKTREKMSKTRKGRSVSVESKKRLSLSHMGELNPMFGKTGNKNHLSIPIICLTNDKEYCSVTEAAKDLRLSRPSISMVLNGRRNHTGGYIFIYKYEME